MGVTGHLAFAIDPGDEQRMIGLLKGEARLTDGKADASFIRYEPNFLLTREDYWGVHCLLKVIAADNPHLALIATAIFGDKLACQVGSGSQYLYTVDDVRHMASSFAALTPEMVRSSFDKLPHDMTADQMNYVTDDIIPIVFAIRDELNKVANHGWAMIAGIY